MEESRAYIYRHIKSCGEVFYIGIGLVRKTHIGKSNPKVLYERAYSKNKRSEFWKNTTNKHKEYEIQVLRVNMSRYEACLLERTLISWYGRADLGLGTLCNHTDGGDGISGYIFTEEDKAKISEAGKGRIPSEESRRKSSESQKGDKNHNYGKKASKETTQKMSIKQARGNNPKAELVLDEEMGIFYDCIRDAAEAYNMTYTKFRRRVKGETKINNFKYKLV